MRLNLCLQYFTPVALLCVALQPCLGQETPPNCVQWKSYTDTVWVEQDVTENRVVSETSFETKEITKSRPRWVSEQRERTITEEKPVEQTSEKIVTRKVRRPITTEKTRTKTRVITSYEKVTEMREEQYTVKKPVIETTYERKEVRVRKPVTRRGVEKEEVTVYRPQQSTDTTMVPGTLLVPRQTSSRNRMRWLQRGYYSDPYTGQPVWRRSGLHWVDEPSYGQNAVPIVVPQQRSSVTMVPETLVREKPYERTTYVDEFETREVPVEVERVIEETRTRKVPVTVTIPKRKVIEEEIPYTETTYVDEEITERVPVTETVMKTVTRTEPYTQIREMWQPYTETVKVPKTTTKRVPYVAKYRVPYLVEVRVPCDANGNPVARGQQVPGTHRLHPAWRKMITKVAGSKESTRETSGTSVFEQSRDSKEDIEYPDAPSSESVLSKGGETEGADAPGDPPSGLKFRNGVRNETSGRLKTIGRANKQDPERPSVPGESESSKRLNREIDQHLIDMGFTKQAETSEATPPSQVETSQRESAPLAEEPSEPAKADFNPESLTLDVIVPPEATPPANISAQPDADDSDDDTIEQDVDISGPNRS